MPDFPGVPTDGLRVHCSSGLVHVVNEDDYLLCGRPMSRNFALLSDVSVPGHPWLLGGQSAVTWSLWKTELPSWWPWKHPIIRAWAVFLVFLLQSELFVHGVRGFGRIQIEDELFKYSGISSIPVSWYINIASIKKMLLFGPATGPEKGPHSFGGTASPKVRGYDLWGPSFGDHSKLKFDLFAVAWSHCMPMFRSKGSACIGHMVTNRRMTDMQHVSKKFAHLIICMIPYCVWISIFSAYHPFRHG